MIFKEVRSTSTNEDVPKEKELEKMEFQLKNEGFDSFEEESFDLDDEVELQTPTLRRSNRLRGLVEMYTPPNLCSTFVLSYISDEPRSIKEAVNYKEGKFWKRTRIEEMEALYKNEAWDLV